MPSRRIFRQPPPRLCTELASEDGIDPRFLRRETPNRVFNRKALQLCRQVERALGLALEGEHLRDLTIQSVEPAPDSSRLLVTVVFHGDLGTPTADVAAALETSRKALRSEVALAIHRKKTPDLAFRVVRAKNQA